MRFPVPALIWAIAIGGCTTTPLEPVVGRLGSPGLGPATAQVITTPQPGGGVQVITDIGRGKRAVKLTAGDTERLVAVLEAAISGWSRRTKAPPFRETLMAASAITSTWNPLAVELTKTPEMSEPVFMLTVGYVDARAVLILDKDNAAMWAKTIRSLTGYGR